MAKAFAPLITFVIFGSECLWDMDFWCCLLKTVFVTRMTFVTLISCGAYLAWVSKRLVGSKLLRHFVHWQEYQNWESWSQIGSLFNCNDQNLFVTSRNQASEVETSLEWVHLDHTREEFRNELAKSRTEWRTSRHEIFKIPKSPFLKLQFWKESWLVGNYLLS